MFGCICLILNGNGLVRVWKDRLIARIGPDNSEEVLMEPQVREFEMIGRGMRIWVAVEPEGVEDDDPLGDWIERAIKFLKMLPRK